MSGRLRYEVLSREDGQCLVAIVRSATPEWIQVVATFPCRSRAEAYARSENNRKKDGKGGRPDEAEQSPTVEASESALSRLLDEAAPVRAQPEPVVQPAQDEPTAIADPQPEATLTPDGWVERTDPEAALVESEAAPAGAQAESSAPNGAEPATQPSIVAAPKTSPKPASAAPTKRKFDDPPPAAGTILKRVAEEIESSLPFLMKKHPKGPTAKDIAAHLGEPEHRVRLAMNHLTEHSKAVLTRRPDSPAHHLVPPGHKPVGVSLTFPERKVLDVLASGARDGLVELSKTQIATASGVGLGSIISHLQALEIKGFIKLDKRGGPQAASRYRILDVSEDAA